MTAATRSTPGPVARLARFIAPQHLKVYAVFWTIVLVVWSVATVVINRFGEIEFSVFNVVGQAAPKWFLFVVGLLIPAVMLPIYVAHGITRRHVFVVAGLVMVPTAVLFGLLTLGIFGLESVVFDLTGITDGLTREPAVSSAAGAARIWGEATLMYLLWTAWGWLVGAGYYRLGPWLGTLFMIPAGVPVAIGEIAVSNDDPGSGFTGLGDVPATAAGVLTVALTLLAIVGSYLLIRDVPIRKVSG